MESLLHFASTIAVPFWVLGLALLVVVAAFLQMRRAQLVIPGWMFTAVLAAIVLFGFGPFAATRYLESQDVHYVQVEVLDLDGHRVSEAAVSASVPGALLKDGSGWKMRIPPDALTGNTSGNTSGDTSGNTSGNASGARKVTFSATQDAAKLAGAKAITLGSDYFPTATIQLVGLPPNQIHGIVLDREGKPVAGAFITLADFPTIASSAADGTFTIPVHATSDQQITVRAQKGSTSIASSGTVGQPVTLRFKQ